MIHIPHLALRIIGLVLILTADVICLIGMRKSYIVAVTMNAGTMIQVAIAATLLLVGLVFITYRKVE